MKLLEVSLLLSMITTLTFASKESNEELGFWGEYWEGWNHNHNPNHHHANYNNKRMIIIL